MTLKKLAGGIENILPEGELNDLLERMSEYSSFADSGLSGDVEDVLGEKTDLGRDFSSELEVKNHLNKLNYNPKIWKIIKVDDNKWIAKYILPFPYPDYNVKLQYDSVEGSAYGTIVSAIGKSQLNLKHSVFREGDSNNYYISICLQGSWCMVRIAEFEESKFLEMFAKMIDQLSKMSN
mgnify:CR=1 FL=1